MNAGAFGGEISKCLQSIDVIKIDGTEKQYSSKDIRFQYRSSSFSKYEIIVGATFILKKDDPNMYADLIYNIEISVHLDKNSLVTNLMYVIFLESFFFKWSFGGLQFRDPTHMYRILETKPYMAPASTNSNISPQNASCNPRHHPWGELNIFMLCYVLVGSNVVFLGEKTLCTLVNTLFNVICVH